MTEATLILNDKNHVDLILTPIKIGLPLTESDIKNLITESDFSNFFSDISNIKNAIAELNSVLKPLQANKTGRKICYQILERRDAVLNVTIDKDEMSALGVITTAMGGKNLTPKAILINAQAQGIKKGFNKEGLVTLAKMAVKAPSGSTVQNPIALGKDPINGKDAMVKLLVQSAQDRILKPVKRDDGSVDMRDFGDIACVKIGESLAKKIPLTDGIKGFTVKNKPLEPTPGVDVEIKIGEGTRLSAKNANILVSEKMGLPRIIDNGMEVDEVYTLKNVDVSTGNITFEGSVIISGNVTEGMKVITSGDITIGGFVESAHLEAVGDITISGGIIGRKQDIGKTKVTDFKMSAVVIAGGNIFAKYCQYADITCGADLHIKNQLMHSILHIKNKLWIGAEDKANGKLIGGYANVGKSVHAGIVGATAGSKTVVHFEKDILVYKEQLSTLEEQIKVSDKKSSELQQALIKLKRLPKEKQNSNLLVKIKNSSKVEIKNLATLLEEKQYLEDKLQQYMNSVYLEATEKLYQDVELKVGEFIDRSKREYGPSRMRYKERKIIIDPIVNT